MTTRITPEFLEKLGNDAGYTRGMVDSIDKKLDDVCKTVNQHSIELSLQRRDIDELKEKNKYRQDRQCYDDSDNSPSDKILRWNKIPVLGRIMIIVIAGVTLGGTVYLSVFVF